MPRAEISRTLVTGGGGFVGANLVTALVEAGYEVHATVRPGGTRWRSPALSGARVHEVELGNFAAVQALVRETRPELVIHAAFASAYAGLALRGLVSDGPRIVAHLLDALGEPGVCRFVHLGSSMEYGAADGPHREDDLLRPDTLRGAVKAAETQLVLQQARRGALPTVVLRVFSVYGPWEAPHRLVPKAIRAALSGDELPLTPPGFGRDYVYATDVAEACLLAASSPAAVGEVFNVGAGRQVTNEEMVAEIERVVGRPVRIAQDTYPPHATDRTTWLADVSKAERILGWRARHVLADGLRSTLAWHRSQPARSVS